MPCCCSAKIGRSTLGRELATVHDYRQRLNQYRTDVGLLAAHEKGPWITVWVCGYYQDSISLSADSIAIG